MNGKLLIGLICCTLILTSCGGGIPINVGLDQNTLERIDAINQQLDRGVEIGPQTRATIKELSNTIRQGAKVGFDAATLQRIDRLLTQIENGPEFGLKPDTLNTLNDLIDTLDNAPEQWESVGEDLINALERSGTLMADRIKEDIGEVLTQARKDMITVIQTGVTTAVATVGAEFRCNVDFVSDKASEKVEAFIGKSIIGKLRAIVAGENYIPPAPIPWICHRIPSEIELVEENGRFVVGGNSQIIKFIGYNFFDNNLPTVIVVAENGEKIDFEPLYPFRGSAYEIDLDLGNKDFSNLPEGARLVFVWPNTENTNGIGFIEPKKVAILKVVKDNVPIRFGPSEDYKSQGVTANRDAIYQIQGRTGDNTWWLIDSEAGYEGWIPNDSVVLLNDEVVEVAKLKYTLPSVGSIVCNKTEIIKPAPINCQGFPPQGITDDGWKWKWDFGDGSVVEQNNPATHTYQSVNVFTIKIEVENDYGYAEGIYPNQIKVIEPTPPPPPPVALGSASSTEGESPLEVVFTNQSTGYITYWNWDFDDDGQPDFTNETPWYSPTPTPHHVFTYNDPSGTSEFTEYKVTLTVGNESDSDTDEIHIKVYPEPKIPEKSIFFIRYKGLSSKYYDDNMNDRLSKVKYKTGFTNNDFICSIAGIRAHGNIISGVCSGSCIDLPLLYMDAFLDNSDGFWTINVYFPGGEQSWDVDMMCINKIAEKKEGVKYLSYGYQSDGTNSIITDNNINYAKTNIDNTYTCGVAGFQYEEGDYDGGYPLMYIKAFGDKNNTTTWKIQSQLENPKNEKTICRKINVLCLSNDKNLGIAFNDYTDSITTSYTFPQYSCGLSGLSLEGYMDTQARNSSTPMIFAIMQKNNNAWLSSVGFRKYINDKYSALMQAFCLPKKLVLYDTTYDCSSGNCKLK